jgi:hypothetical protein
MKDLKEEMKSQMVDLVESIFPKGDTERSKATFLMAKCFILADQALLAQRKEFIKMVESKRKITFGYKGIQKMNTPTTYRWGGYNQTLDDLLKELK